MREKKKTCSAPVVYLVMYCVLLMYERKSAERIANCNKAHDIKYSLVAATDHTPATTPLMYTHK